MGLLDSLIHSGFEDAKRKSDAETPEERKKRLLESGEMTEADYPEEPGKLPVLDLTIVSAKKKPPRKGDKK